MKRIGYILVITAMAVFHSTFAFSQPSPATRPIQEHERAALLASRSLIEQGRTVAETACSACHGEKGVSTTPGSIKDTLMPKGAISSERASPNPPRANLPAQ